MKLHFFDLKSVRMSMCVISQQQSQSFVISRIPGTCECLNFLQDAGIGGKTAITENRDKLVCVENDDLTVLDYRFSHNSLRILFECPTFFIIYMGDLLL